jgi:hypothetical protein
MAAILVRCQKCQRPFARVADCCPDCGALSGRGMRAAILKVGSIVGTIVALAVAFSLVHKSRAMQEQGHPTEAVMVLPPLERPDGAISFAEK